MRQSLRYLDTLKVGDRFGLEDAAHKLAHDDAVDFVTIAFIAARTVARPATPWGSAAPARITGALPPINPTVLLRPHRRSPSR